MTILTIVITTARKALATIALISIAAGEVIGGATFGFFGHLTSRWWHLDDPYAEHGGYHDDHVVDHDGAQS